MASVSEERLALQMGSLEESFETLTRASHLKDLARRFFHILSGNLVTTNIGVYYTSTPHSVWEKLYGKEGDEDEACLGDTPEAFALKSFGGKTPKVAAVHPLSDRSSIGVVLGRLLGGAAYSSLEKLSIHIFLQMFAAAYHVHLQQRKEKALIFSLNHRLLQLNSLIDTGIEMTRGKNHIAPQALALERAPSLTNASWGTFRKKVGKTVAETLVFPNAPQPRKPSESAHHIRSRFTFRGSPFLFDLYEKDSRTGPVPFDETDQLLLDAVAQQVHAVVESAFFQQQELERQKIEQDIALAASIQQRILATVLPRIAGYDIFGANIPTRAVGGDYYDCIPLGDGRIAMVIADVAGKGIPTALLVSSFHAYLTAFLEQTGTLVEIAQRLHRAIHRASTAERYITALVGILDHASGTLRTINAGHNPAYVLRSDGTLLELSKGGIAFGMIDMDFPYEHDTLQLDHGDRVLLYTDGVTEAMKGTGQLYDHDNALKTYFVNAKPARAEEFVRGLLADVARFTASALQSDDITAMYLLRL